jgi:hypothetical protein
LSDSTAVRINGAFEDADSFRDTVHTKRSFASPSILSKLSNDTSIWYELEWSRQEIPFDRGVVARNGQLGIIPNSRFLGEPGDGPTVAKVRDIRRSWSTSSGRTGCCSRRCLSDKLNGISRIQVCTARNQLFTDRPRSPAAFLRLWSTDSIARAG